MTTNNIPKWYAKGLLFENCNCQLICPAHVSFKQNCTNEQCTGYWAIRFNEGAYGDIPVDSMERRLHGKMQKSHGFPAHTLAAR